MHLLIDDSVEGQYITSIVNGSSCGSGDSGNNNNNDNMEHEGDSETNSNRCTQNNPERICIGSGWLGNKKTSCDLLDSSIIKFGQNAKESPGDCENWKRKKQRDK